MLRATLAILVAALCVAGLGRGRAGPDPLLLPYQRPFDALEPETQTIAREARLALEEVALLRHESGTWPPPGRLLEEGILPFAPLPLARGLVEYRWQIEQGDGRVRYLGRAGAGAPALLLLLEEAPERADPVHRSPSRADDFHQRLPDGSLLHATLWIAGPSAETPAATPQASGWLQVVPGVLARDAEKNR